MFLTIPPCALVGVWSRCNGASALDTSSSHLHAPCYQGVLPTYLPPRAGLPAQEDEIATTVLSGGTSPYTAIMLPREERRCLRQLYTFGGGEGGTRFCGIGGGKDGAELHGGGCSDAAATARRGADSAAVARQFQEWQRCFLHFLKKAR